MRNNQKGIIALVVILIVASLTLVYGLAVALMAIDETSTSIAWLSKSKSTSYGVSCVANALGRLRNNTSLTGNVNISVGNVNCTATISNPGANIRTIATYATATDGLGRSIVDSVSVNVNVGTNPFTVTWYKDILE